MEEKMGRLYELEVGQDLREKYFLNITGPMYSSACRSCSCLHKTNLVHILEQKEEGLTSLHP